MVKALLIEDDRKLADLLREFLAQHGVEAVVAPDGVQALSLLALHRFDILLLDLMLPGMDGLTLARRVRERWPTPIIMVTARGDDADKIVGLELGADDYLAKPFNPRELLARIRAVLRRSTGPQRAAETPRLSFADIELDEESHEVVKAGQVVSLSPTEFKLLRYLMANAGRVLSKAQILDHVWNYDFNGEANVVESYISYLRRKIDTTEPRLLHTIRGVGYTLRLPRGT
ncbi:MAG: response regulator transcription factor [Myxococcales bacterium]